MATFVRIQLSQGHERAFPSDGLKLAVTEALNAMSKRNEKNPNTLDADLVFDCVINAWKRIGTETTTPTPKEGVEQEHHKAMPVVGTGRVC